MTSRRRLALAAVLLLPALAVAVLPEPAGAEVGGAVTKLTRAEGGGNATGASSSPAVSSDGRVVAYLSDATDLVEGQPDTPGVYATVLDPETRTVRLADAPSRPGACGPLPRPAVSADGTTVAFTTDDPDLVEGDENGVEDVFVVELATRPPTVERVSVAATGGDADGPSCAPALSADGSVVVFDSAATDLVDDDADGQADVFVRDRTAGGAEGATRLVSGDLDGAALEPDLSDDGSRAVLEVLDGEVSEVVLADLDSETTTSLTPAPTATASTRPSRATGPPSRSRPMRPASWRTTRTAAPTWWSPTSPPGSAPGRASPTTVPRRTTTAASRRSTTTVTWSPSRPSRCSPRPT